MAITRRDPIWFWNGQRRTETAWRVQKCKTVARSSDVSAPRSNVSKTTGKHHHYALAFDWRFYATQA